MVECTAAGLRLLQQAGDQLAQRIVLKARQQGRTMNQRMLAYYLITDHLEKHGEPWERQPWQFKGPSLADMFSGRRLRTIPRELRRIYAPYP